MSRRKRCGAKTFEAHQDPNAISVQVNFGNTGVLAAETNMVNGVVVKFQALSNYHDLLFRTIKLHQSVAGAAGATRGKDTYPALEVVYFQGVYTDIMINSKSH